MCIEASKSSDFYGKDVELHGLKKVEMNGCLGVQIPREEMCI